jgi:hypothetical protein
MRIPEENVNLYLVLHEFTKDDVQEECLEYKL